MAPTPAHLIFLIHGLYGTPANLDTVRTELTAAAALHREHVGGEGTETVLCLAKSFTGSHTWDGIDVNAHRAAKELDREVERLEEEAKDVVAISIIGYSLGGLIARYLVGLLHARQPSFFARHRPASFSTAATPHLGVLKYGSRVNTIVHTVGRQLFSRSGQQLYCLDKDPRENGRCLLEVLADPDRVYLRALKLFPRIKIVANGCNDLTVPYPSASISLTDPFEAHELTRLRVKTDADHVVQSWHLPHGDTHKPDDVEVAVEDSPEAGSEVMTRKRPKVFPMFLLPWPFTYAAFIIFPLLLPFILVYAFGLFTLHTFQSQRRARIHHASLEAVPLLGDTDLAPTSASADNSQSSQLTFTSSTPPLDEEPTSGRSTPPLASPPDAAHPSQTPLLLTPKQKTMAHNLNDALPQLERLIAWYPWVFNAHAMLIVRMPKRFPWQEEGRGFVRRWAQWVVESAPAPQATSGSA